jgi:hypothetical protein
MGGNVVRLPRYLWIVFGAGVVGTMAIALFAARSQLTLKSTIGAIAVVVWAVGYLVANSLIAKMKHTMSSSNYEMTNAFKRQFIRFSSALAALLLISGGVAISIGMVVTRLRQELLIVGIGTCVFGAYWLGLARRAKHKNRVAGHTHAPRQ